MENLTNWNQHSHHRGKYRHTNSLASPVLIVFAKYFILSKFYKYIEYSTIYTPPPKLKNWGDNIRSLRLYFLFCVNKPFFRFTHNHNNN